MYDSIIHPDILEQHLTDPNWIIFDCRFELSDPKWGQAAYFVDHIPNAYFADLEFDLSSPKKNDTGRHPLPEMDTFVEKLSRWGVNNNKQVVVYDHLSGAFSARLWCLLRYLGHNAVAVLDGGYNAWKNDDRPVTQTIPEYKPTNFMPDVQTQLFITSHQLEEILEQDKLLLIDSRAELRFSGVEEPIDPVAGHIPNAVNHFHQNNLTEAGYFKSDQELKRIFANLTSSNLKSKEIVVYCGSGVTSCLNLVALQKIGITHGKLYLGSWSEWIVDPQRPIIKE